jgi:hypothetical protein
MIFSGQLPNGGMRESRRQAAMWKFAHLDKNGDKVSIYSAFVTVRFVGPSTSRMEIVPSVH